MFKDLLLHPQTRETLELFASNPSHAVLITGPSGAGKSEVAKLLAAALLNVDGDALDLQPHFIRIRRAEDKKDISIEQVRDVIKELGLKIPGKGALKRVILIEDAGKMSQPAQNALLKSLEEPSVYSVFILTAQEKSELLPTISSRATKISINPVNLPAAKRYFKASQGEVEAAWNLSRGLPSLMNRLLSEDSGELRSSIERGKEFLAMSPYERTLALDRAGRDKTELDQLLNALARIVQALYKNAAAKNESKKLRVLARAMKLILSAQTALAGNAAPRLVALQISTNLPI